MSRSRSNTARRRTREGQRADAAGAIGARMVGILGEGPLGPFSAVREAASAGPERGRSQLGIHILQRVLDVGEFLIEFAQAGLQIGHVIREALHLRAHGVQARAGSGREILRVFLHGGHGDVEFVDRIQRLLDQRSLHGGVLRDCRLHSLLALNQLGDAGLQFNNFARDGTSRRGAKQCAAQGSREHGCTEK